jgi:hypothetical protein
MWYRVCRSIIHEPILGLADVNNCKKILCIAHVIIIVECLSQNHLHVYVARMEQHILDTNEEK